jgi:hypothetical protein
LFTRIEVSQVFGACFGYKTLVGFLVEGIYSVNVALAVKVVDLWVALIDGLTNSSLIARYANMDIFLRVFGL